MEIRVSKITNGYKSRLVRLDGVCYALSGVGRKFVPPHDIAHVIVEDGLQISNGFMGTIAQGGVFESMVHVTGRRSAHAAQKSKEIRKQNRHGIQASEVATGAFQEALLEHEKMPFLLLRERLNHRPELHRSKDQYLEIWGELKRVGALWNKLKIGGSLTLCWPYRGATEALE